MSVSSFIFHFQDLRYQLAEPGFWANIKHNQHNQVDKIFKNRFNVDYCNRIHPTQGYQPMPILEQVPIKRGTWKRKWEFWTILSLKPTHLSNYSIIITFLLSCYYTFLGLVTWATMPMQSSEGLDKLDKVSDFSKTDKTDALWPLYINNFPILSIH